MFDEAKLCDVVKEIDFNYIAFSRDAGQIDVKAAARRARKTSLKIEKLLKEYRRISIK